ncbi:MAG: hypothetical protein ACT4PX_11395 [Actinomycetota bacterium]
MRRLCAAVAALFVTAVVAAAAYDPPAPLVTAVARAAEVAIPPPVTTAAAPAPTQAVPATEPTTTAAPPTTAAPSTTTAAPLATVAPLTVPIPTTAPPPPTTAAPARAPLPAAGMAPYLGLGTWVDVYDWTHGYTNGSPTVAPGDAGAMAGAGVQTLFIQASKHDSPTDVVEPELLQDHIDRAKKAGLRVVAWYLPTLVDPGRDLARLKAVAALRDIDGLAVDIEARNVADVGERNRRLVDLGAALRAALPGRTIAGIVLPPVALEVINPNYWPSFPYREIAPHYDLWMTMGYWTNRTAASGYRDAYRYTKENVDRLRNNLGQPDAPVHPIGGIGHSTTAADVEGYKRAVTAVGGIGGSIYDWHTTAGALWERLRAMRLR